MSTSIKQLRMQVLSRSINRRQLTLTNLKGQLNAGTIMCESAQSTYNNAYNHLHNLSETLSEEDKQMYTQQMERSQNIIYAIAERDNDVELQINTQNTLLEMEDAEHKNLKQSMSKTVKDEAPKTQP